MGTELHTLQPPAGSRKRRKRLGRGLGSGRGKTSGRGMKGQLYRRTAMRVSFEGGQLPIHMRIPKRGFINIHRVDVHGVNIGNIVGAFAAGDEVTPEVLHERGLVPKKANVIKLLGGGEVDKALKISVHRISASAKAKVEAAGGSVTLLAEPQAQEAEAAAEG